MKFSSVLMLLGVGLGYHSTSFAVLGEPATSVTSESASMHAKHSQKKFTVFTRHVLTQKRLSVREFTSKTGKVFAVAWNGTHHPDLTILLGSHFSEYKKAFVQAKKTRRGHSPIAIDLGNIHVEQGGIARALFGRVWLRDQIPNGADINEIR